MNLVFDQNTIDYLLEPLGLCLGNGEVESFAQSLRRQGWFIKSKKNGGICKVWMDDGPWMYLVCRKSRHIGEFLKSIEMMQVPESERMFARDLLKNPYFGMSLEKMMIMRDLNGERTSR